MPAHNRRGVRIRNVMRTAVSMERLGKHVSAETNSRINRRAVFSVWSVLRGYKNDSVGKKQRSWHWIYMAMGPSGYRCQEWACRLVAGSKLLLLLLEQYDSDKRQTRPLVREGAPKRQGRDCQTVINIWSWAPEGSLNQDWLTDWLTASRNVTLTLTCWNNILQVGGVSNLRQ
jgi:hypothetical protein